MWQYIVRRLLQIVPVLLLITFMAYSLILAIPGDPARALIGPGESLDEEQLELIRKEYNLGDMIKQRLQVLQEHKFIRQDGDRWYLQPKGQLFARTMQASSWIYQSKSQRERE